MIVGADRVAANGDVANKVGTYGLAVLAHHHGVPFYVAAPRVDHRPGRARRRRRSRSSSGAADEVTPIGGHRIAPDGMAVENRAFDVTPAGLVTALITEDGVISPGSLASPGRDAARRSGPPVCRCPRPGVRPGQRTVGRRAGPTGAGNPAVDRGPAGLPPDRGRLRPGDRCCRRVGDAAVDGAPGRVPGGADARRGAGRVAGDHAGPFFPSCRHRGWSTPPPSTS